MPRPHSHARILALALALAALAPVLGAQQAPTVVTKITADIGYVAVTGNTQVTTFNIGEKLTQSRGRLSLEQGVGLVYSTQADSGISN